MPKTVTFTKNHPDAIVPSYAHAGDAGADLCSVEDYMLKPGESYLFNTGISMSMPNDWVGLVHPRSGLAAKKKVTVLNAPGTVDSGYRGLIKVNLINHSTEPVSIAVGDRIAQIVFQKFETATFVEAEELTSTIRGTGGHGSTGD